MIERGCRAHSTLPVFQGHACSLLALACKIKNCRHQVHEDVQGVEHAPHTSKGKGKKEKRKKTKQSGQNEERRGQESGKKRKQRLSFRKGNGGGKGKRKGLSLVWGYFLNGYR